MSEVLESVDNDAGWYSNETATFGDRIAGAREALGLSQEQLAHRMGIKLKTLQSWEDDHGEPRANKLQMLSGILNVSLPWLLNGEGEGVAGPGSEAALDSDLNNLLVEMRQLRTSIAQAGEKLASLEKRLRFKLKDRS